MSANGYKNNKCKVPVPEFGDLGTASNAGLCKTINDFNKPSGDQSGRALAASAGYVLAQQISSLQTTVGNHTNTLASHSTRINKRAVIVAAGGDLEGGSSITIQANTPLTNFSFTTGYTLAQIEAGMYPIVFFHKKTSDPEQYKIPNDMVWRWHIGSGGNLVVMIDNPQSYDTTVMVELCFIKLENDAV